MSLFKVRCAKCETNIGVTSRYLGKVVSCPACSSRVRIPTKATATKSRVQVTCKFCSVKIDIPEKKLGSTVKCPKCDQLMRLKVRKNKSDNKRNESDNKRSIPSHSN